VMDFPLSRGLPGISNVNDMGTLQTVLTLCKFADNS